MGDTYGSAYVAMGARSISDADMVFAWDDAKVGMMEAEKAANILFAAEGEKATEKQAAAYEGKQNAVTSAAAKRQCGCSHRSGTDKKTSDHGIFHVVKERKIVKMRKNIKGIAAGSLGLLALQLPGMTVFAQAAGQKSPTGKCITEYSPWIWERYSLC